VAEKLPTPKEGLLVRKADADRIRKGLIDLQDDPTLVGKKGIRTVADHVVRQWPTVKSAVELRLNDMLDLEKDRNPLGIVPDATREAAGQLGEMVHATAN